ncbi:hypothetical protein Tco_0300369, partial [Tanacetum coccineum]
VSPWKGVVRFGKRGKLNLRYVRPFKVLAKVGKVAYKLELPQELSRVHHTFHFVEEPAEIMEREIKRLKRSRIPLVKLRWNSRRGPEFTWEREDSSIRHEFEHKRGFRFEQKKEATCAFYDNGLLWSLILSRVSLSIVAAGVIFESPGKESFAAALIRIRTQKEMASNSLGGTSLMRNFDSGLYTTYGDVEKEWPQVLLVGQT